MKWMALLAIITCVGCGAKDKIDAEMDADFSQPPQAGRSSAYNKAYADESKKLSKEHPGWKQP
jgi:hypothetical protein